MTDNIKYTTPLPPIACKILERIRMDFPSRLAYHGNNHTAEVIQEVITFGREDKLDPRDLQILIIAAAFHDSGFLYKGGQNEDLGAMLAETEMNKDGSYTKKETEEVKNCILSTKIGKNYSRTARSELSKYLMDADVGNLGRVDFFEKTEQLIEELELNNTNDRNNFLKKSVVLLESHEWLTPAAKKLRGDGIRKNIIELKKIVSQI